MKFFNKIKELFHDENTSQTHESLKEKSAKENYIENKNEALNIICGYLARYSYSNDRNLAVLNLWTVLPITDSQVAWADENFLKELKVRLHQEMIEAVKTIEIKSVSKAELSYILKQDPTIKPMLEGRLYYKTHAQADKESMSSRKAPAAWLLCIGGRENVRSTIVRLDSESKTVWNIGRSEHPSITDTNDIVINNECTDISRQQAAIIMTDGNYYVKCKTGGCRARGGRVTKIIRTNGTKEELVSLSPKALSHLNEGDVIQLAHSVYFRFSYTEPENPDQPAALLQVDDTF